MLGASEWSICQVTELGTSKIAFKKAFPKLTDNKVFGKN